MKPAEREKDCLWLQQRNCESCTVAVVNRRYQQQLLLECSGELDRSTQRGGKGRLDGKGKCRKGEGKDCLLPSSPKRPGSATVYGRLIDDRIKRWSSSVRPSSTTSRQLKIPADPKYFLPLHYAILLLRMVIDSADHLGCIGNDWQANGQTNQARYYLMRRHIKGIKWKLMMTTMTED